MITICRKAERSMLREEVLPAKLLRYAPDANPWPMALNENGKEIGTVLFACRNGTAVLDLSFAPDATQDEKRRAVHSVVFDAECRWKPHEILTIPADPAARQILTESMFYPKGTLYRRAVEPWRYLLKDSCFDREGMLINQGAVTAIPFGLKRSSENGCGWIAAYNLLKLNGREQTMEETVRGLSWLNLGKLQGENIFNLALYLRRKGLPVRLAVGRSAVVRAMKNAQSGILLYSTKLLHAHFVCWKKADHGKCCFYNAVYGRTEYLNDPETFLKQHVKGLNRMALYIG